MQVASETPHVPNSTHLGAGHAATRPSAPLGATVAGDELAPGLCCHALHVALQHGGDGVLEADLQRRQGEGSGDGCHYIGHLDLDGGVGGEGKCMQTMGQATISWNGGEEQGGA